MNERPVAPEKRRNPPGDPRACGNHLTPVPHSFGAVHSLQRLAIWFVAVAGCGEREAAFLAGLPGCGGRVRQALTGEQAM